MNFTVTKGITFSSEIIEPQKLNMALPSITLTENQIDHTQISGTLFQPDPIGDPGSTATSISMRNDLPILLLFLNYTSSNSRTITFTGLNAGDTIFILAKNAATFTGTLTASFVSETGVTYSLFWQGTSSFDMSSSSASNRVFWFQFFVRGQDSGEVWGYQTTPLLAV